MTPELPRRARRGGAERSPAFGRRLLPLPAFGRGPPVARGSASPAGRRRGGDGLRGAEPPGARAGSAEPLALGLRGLVAAAERPVSAGGRAGSGGGSGAGGGRTGTTDAGEEPPGPVFPEAPWARSEAGSSGSERLGAAGCRPQGLPRPPGGLAGEVAAVERGRLGRLGPSVLLRSPAAAEVEFVPARLQSRLVKHPGASPQWQPRAVGVWQPACESVSDRERIFSEMVIFLIYFFLNKTRTRGVEETSE